MRACLKVIQTTVAATLAAAVLSSCGDEPKEPEQPPPPPPLASCSPTTVETAFGTPTEDPARKTCSWSGATSAATDQTRPCLVGDGELSGSAMNPGVGNIELRRNGSQVTFAKTATGDAPWTYQVTELNCNTTGQCAEIFDKAEYEVVISNAQGLDCSSFGDIRLSIPLHD